MFLRSKIQEVILRRRSRSMNSAGAQRSHVPDQAASSWVDHLVSGLRPRTHAPYSDSLSLRLRIFCLTLHEIVTRRFILQKARHHPLTGSDYLYFNRRRPRTHVVTTTTTTTRRRGWWHRTNPNRRAGGYKAALSNPNTTSTGIHHAKAELRSMGRSREARVPLSTRIKRFFGIRSHRRHY